MGTSPHWLHTTIRLLPRRLKENALFPPPEVFLQFFPQQAGQARGVSLPEFLLHIHQAHLRHLVGIVSLPEGKQVILSHLRGIPALHRRGRRPQQKQSLMVGAAELGHLPGVVTDHALRLIAALLLLIQNHKAHIRQRGKHRGTSPNDHRGLSIPDPLPLVVPLPGGQAAVQDRHLPAEMGEEELQQAGGQGNFRDHYNGPPSRRQGLLDQMEVDLGLPAAGDPVEEGRLRLSPVHQRPQPFIGRLLRLVQRRQRLRLPDIRQLVAEHLPLL